jgi:dienelactone hydrolase
MNGSNAMQQIEVIIPTAGVSLAGNLIVPEAAEGIVLFVHGSGSSRFSPRNRFVAGLLNEAGFATLLFDLLTIDEHQLDQQTRQLRFDINMLTQRLSGTIDWVCKKDTTSGLRIGLFGASTGAAAALVTAAEKPDMVFAVVSRGGRPDLAGNSLSKVKAPTLLIVGANDPQVLELNRTASQSLGGEFRLEIIPGASHLFEEPGTLEEATSFAREWFKQYLSEALQA